MYYYEISANSNSNSNSALTDTAFRSEECVMKKVFVGAITDLINVKIWIRRDDSASRVVNPLSRQISSKSTLLSFQSLYKSSGSFLRLIIQIE